MKFKINTVERTDNRLVLESNSLWLAKVLFILEILAISLGIQSAYTLQKNSVKNCQQSIESKEITCHDVNHKSSFALDSYMLRGILMVLPLQVMTLLLIMQIQNVRCELDRRQGSLRIIKHNIIRKTTESYPIKDIIDIKLKYQDNKAIAPIVFELNSQQELSLKFFVSEQKEKIQAIAKIREFIQ